MSEPTAEVKYSPQLDMFLAFQEVAIETGNDRLSRYVPMLTREMFTQSASALHAETRSSRSRKTPHGDGCGPCTHPALPGRPRIPSPGAPCDG